MATLIEQARAKRKEADSGIHTQTVLDMGGSLIDAAKLKRGDSSGLSEAFTSQPVTDERSRQLESLNLSQYVQEPVKYEEQGSYGQYKRKDFSGEPQPFLQAAGQGLQNMGAGYIRAYNELAALFGDEKAKQVLSDLEISQTMDQAQTEQITQGHPVQAFAGEVAGETAGFPLGGGGKSAITKVVTGALSGAGAGGISSAGRGQDMPGVVGETALGGITGAGADLLMQGGGNLLRRFRNRGGMVEPDAGVDELRNAAGEVAEARRITDETGIGLFQGQQTMDQWGLERQSFLGSLPESSRRAYTALQTQNEEVASAVQRLMSDVAPESSVGTSAALGRKAADQAIEAARKKRSDIASPLYKEAFAVDADVDLAPVNDIISEIVSELPAKGSRIGSKVKEAKALIEGRTVVAADGAETVIPPTLKQLHGAKMQIDEMIAGTGVEQLGPTTKRYLTQIKASLVDQMTSASGGYKTASDAFKAASPEVDVLLDGMVGRIAGLKTTNLKSLSNLIFDAAETNPTVMRDTIRTLRGTEGGDDLVQSLLRTQMQQRLGKMRVGIDDMVADGATSVNVPLNVESRLFGNAAQRKLMFAALDEISPQAGQNARWLSKGLQRAKSGRPGGSQTAIRGEVKERMRGISGAVRNFFAKPVQTLANVGEEAAWSRKVEALGDAMYNPDWRPDMNRIRRLDPNSAEAQSQFTQLLTRIVETGTNIAESANISGAGQQALSTAGRVAASDLLENEQ